MTDKEHHEDWSDNTGKKFRVVVALTVLLAGLALGLYLNYLGPSEKEPSKYKLANPINSSLPSNPIKRSNTEPEIDACSPSEFSVTDVQGETCVQVIPEP